MLLALSLHDLDVRFTDWAHGLDWPTEPLLRLCLAAVLGGLVGLEREVRGRHAGFRTNLLVSLGCALVMIVSIAFAFHPWPHVAGVNLSVDPARVAYGVMAGIGFLGAGVIVKHKGGVHGLTTAAGMWCVAAIGLACGLGLYLIAAWAAVIVVAALWFLERVERWLPRPDYRTLVVRRAWRPGVVRETATLVARHVAPGVRDPTFERVGDLSAVDISLYVALRGDDDYQRLERELAALPDCELISTRTDG